MTAQQEFEEAVAKATTIDEAVESLEKFAPKKKNCFTCKQRFIGNCPIFTASAIEISTQCRIDFEMFKTVAIVCCIGCESYD